MRRREMLRNTKKTWPEIKGLTREKANGVCRPKENADNRATSPYERLCKDIGAIIREDRSNESNSTPSNRSSRGLNCLFKGLRELFVQLQLLIATVIVITGSLAALIGFLWVASNYFNSL